MRPIAILAILSLILAICGLAGCQSETSGAPTPLDTQRDGLAETPTSVPNSPTLTPMHLPTTPAATSLSEPVSDSTPTLVSNHTSSLTPGVIPKNICPTSLDDQNTSPIMLGGSVLFGTGDIGPDRLSYPFAYSLLPENPGVWAISTPGQTSRLVYEIPAGVYSSAYVSPGGAILIHFGQEGVDSPGEADVYNLETGERSQIPVSSSRVLDWKWLSNDRFQYLADVVGTVGQGESREYVILDLASRQSETVIEQVDMPGYLFLPEEIEKGIPSGYAAVDPSGQLVLYSTSMPDDEVAIVLRHRQSGEVLWQQNNPSIPAYDQPLWSADGSRVTFSVGVPISGTSYAWEKIISLTRDGQAEELPRQPYPRTEETGIRYLTRSPDDRYILYGAIETVSMGPAFVVDTVTGEIGEICDPGPTFIDGEWLSDSQFIYRVVVEQNGQAWHSLGILDIPSWTTQTLFESGPGYGVNIFGWTPVDMSQLRSPELVSSYSD